MFKDYFHVNGVARFKYSLKHLKLPKNHFKTNIFFVHLKNLKCTFTFGKQLNIRTTPFSYHKVTIFNSHIQELCRKIQKSLINICLVVCSLFVYLLRSRKEHRFWAIVYGLLTYKGGMKKYFRIQQSIFALSFAF